MSRFPASLTLCFPTCNNTILTASSEDQTDVRPKEHRKEAGADACCGQRVPPQHELTEFWKSARQALGLVLLFIKLRSPERFSSWFKVIKLVKGDTSSIKACPASQVTLMITERRDLGSANDWLEGSLAASEPGIPNSSGPQTLPG